MKWSLPATSLTSLFAMLLAVSVAAQSPPATPRVAAAPKAVAASCVDTVIELVTGGMSEGQVIRALKREGKSCKLTPADLLKLQKAGVSENIIDAMIDPAVGTAAPASPTAAPPVDKSAAAAFPEAAGAVSSYPRDLPDIPASRKRRLTVDPFDYSTVTPWVNYWFSGNNINIGEGIRAMLTVRMQQAKNITLLERKKIADVMKEQDFEATNRVRKGPNAKIGQITGADVMLYGDIVIFGRDDRNKRDGLSALLRQYSPIAAAAFTMRKNEKAVVGINLRMVDAETGEVLATAEARGESSRSSTDVGGFVGVKGLVIGGASDMTSSNFQQTIIGEATSNAVTDIVRILEDRIPQLPAKARQIEGLVASVTTSGAVLTVGSEAGVLRGDRFEILKINGEIKDPVTKEVIDLDAVKIGEFVADNVRDKSATGQYGGEPLSSTYATTTGKGYAARLISK